MTLRSLIKPIVVSCLLPLALTANAEDKMFDNKADHNFFMIKAGVDQPTVGSNNANIANVKTTFVGGFEVGRKFMERFAVSVEYNHRGKSDFLVDSDSLDDLGTNNTWAVKSDTVMANLAVDLVQDSKITPYVKAGVGTSRNTAYGFNGLVDKTKANFAGKTVTKFTWQLGVGLNLTSTSMIDTDIAYTFTDRGRVETATGLDVDNLSYTARYAELRDHAVTIGIKIKF